MQVGGSYACVYGRNKELLPVFAANLQRSM